MTKEGLVHMERGRFEKKDQRKIDDRRSWSLGFSNKSRLVLLNSDKKKAEIRLEELAAMLSEARKSLNSVAERAKLWERIDGYSWEQIDAPYWQKRLDTVKADLERFEQSGGNLELAKSRWDAAKTLLQDIQKNKEQLKKDEGALETKKDDAQRQAEKYRLLASTGMSRSEERRVGK